MDFDALARKAIEEFRAKQDPDELADFLRWLSKVRPRPEYVVEIGVYRGGNMWAMQQVVPEAGFIGIDRCFKRLDSRKFKSGTILVCGNSGDVKDLVGTLYDPDRALVYIDGDHSYEAVLRDVNNYPARYQAFHDIKDGEGHSRKRACHFYQEHSSEFTHAFSRYSHRLGIGIREAPVQSQRGAAHGADPMRKT